MKQFFFIILSVSLFAACRPHTTYPKPRGWFITHFPEKKYQEFDSTPFPYSFEYPSYAIITQDTNLLKNEHEPYWINIEVPSLNAVIYLTYKAITPNETLEKLVNESYKLTFAHDKRADYINDTTRFHSQNGLQGVVYTVGGNAASAYQFFATDNNKNFIRGALYFNATPNADSLKPSIDFMKKDMDHLMETLRFK